MIWREQGSLFRRVGWLTLLFLTAVVMHQPVLGQDRPDEPQGAESRVAEVTLYRDQAQILREVAVPAGEGAIELTVIGLPDQVIRDSLFAEGGEQIDVRAVRFRQRVVGEEPREEIRNLDQAIEDKQIEIEENAAMMALVQSRFVYLDKLENFAATTATAELGQGKLDAEQLQQTTRFIFEERELATQRRIELRTALRGLQRELQTLQQQRQLLAGRTQRVVREAVLFLDRRDAGAESVRLTYLVSNCGWAPSYNVRGDLDGNTIRVEYNALIRQMTGEDWTGVKLTLSTASPMISAASPGLAVFPVKLTPVASGGLPPAAVPVDPGDQRRAAQGQRERAAEYFSLREQREFNARLNGNAIELDANFDNAWSGNTLANRAQLLEMCFDLPELMVEGVSGSGQAMRGLSITYELPGRVSLQSRADQQMTRIMQSDMDASFYHVAVPVLSPFVYREAETVNTSGQDLLAGPVSVYLDGKFVGRTEVVSVTRGQTFVLGFGADPQLSTARQLVNRDQTSQGGNTLLSFDYRLSIENYGDQPAKVRLLDRLPYFNGGDDVNLTIASMSDELSEDAVYLRLDRPNGILRWDIDVPANATGADESVVSFLYTLEFDRNYGFSVESDDRAKQEFFERQLQQRAR
ncbi:MAG: DUF4139 domain-containing protein [Planctomycetota bacterium]